MPELAFWTASIDSVRIVLTQSWSSVCDSVTVLIGSLVLRPFRVVDPGAVSARAPDLIAPRRVSCQRIVGGAAERLSSASPTAGNATTDSSPAPTSAAAVAASIACSCTPSWAATTDDEGQRGRLHEAGRERRAVAQCAPVDERDRYMHRKQRGEEDWQLDRTRHAPEQRADVEAQAGGDEEEGHEDAERDRLDPVLAVGVGLVGLPEAADHADREGGQDRLDAQLGREADGDRDRARSRRARESAPWCPRAGPARSPRGSARRRSPSWQRARARAARTGRGAAARSSGRCDVLRRRTRAARSTRTRPGCCRRSRSGRTASGFDRRP